MVPHARINFPLLAHGIRASSDGNVHVAAAEYQCTQRLCPRKVVSSNTSIADQFNLYQLQVDRGSVGGLLGDKQS